MLAPDQHEQQTKKGIVNFHADVRQGSATGLSRRMAGENGPRRGRESGARGGVSASHLEPDFCEGGAQALVTLHHEGAEAVTRVQPVA